MKTHLFFAGLSFYLAFLSQASAKTWGIVSDAEDPPVLLNCQLLSWDYCNLRASGDPGPITTRSVYHLAFLQSVLPPQEKQLVGPLPSLSPFRVRCQEPISSQHFEALAEKGNFGRYRSTLWACRAAVLPVISPEPARNIYQVETTRKQKIALYALKRFRGLRYCSKPEKARHSCTDCSFLVQQAYKKYNISIPRTAAKQCKNGKRVPLSQARAGDIVCFSKYSRYSKKITHVGMMTSTGKVIHATVKAGVVIDNIASWKRYPKHQKVYLVAIRRPI